MIKSMQIKNFRQFDELKIDNLKRVNFLVGKNNCGKTSVLEALFIMTNPYNAELWVKISMFRGILIDNTVVLNAFRNLEETFIEMSIQVDTQICTIHVQPKRDDVISLDTNDLNGNNTLSKIYNYDTVIKDKDGTTINPHKSFLKIDKQNISFSATPNQLDIYGIGIYLSDKLSNINNAVLNLYKNMKEKELIELVKLFDSKITSVSLLGNDVYVDIDGIRLPIQLMGDGLNKYINILSTLIDGQCNYIFIDEIENGLHHLTQRKLLKAILKLSEEQNIQLFITTHSLETLTFLSEIMQEEDFLEQKDDVQVINIANTKLKGFLVTNYKIDGIQRLIENESEFRG